MKEHYFVIKWTEADGWELDNDTLAVWCGDRPIYDTETNEWLRVYDDNTDSIDFKLSKELVVTLEAQNKAGE